MRERERARGGRRGTAFIEKSETYREGERGRVEREEEGGKAVAGRGWTARTDALAQRACLGEGHAGHQTTRSPFRNITVFSYIPGTDLRAATTRPMAVSTAEIIPR